MGCICRGLYIRSTKPLLDEYDTRPYVNHVEEKFLSHLHCMVFGDFWGHWGSQHSSRSFVTSVYYLLRIQITFGSGDSLYIFGVVFIVPFRIAHFPLFDNSSYPTSNENAHRRARISCFHYLSKYPL